MRYLIRYIILIFGYPLLLLLGPVSKKYWSAVCSVARHFGYDPKPNIPIELRPSLPIIPFKKIDGLCDDIKLLESLELNGNITLLELVAINKIIKAIKPSAVFEIGTFNGRTTLNMAANLNKGGKVFTLDLPPEKIESTNLKIEEGDRKFIDKPESGKYFHNCLHESRITQLFGDSANFNFTPYKNQIDLIFVDGSHSYDYVLNDSKNALKLLKNKSGIILWHDYGKWNGVTKALNELQKSDPRLTKIRQIENTSIVILTNTL